MNEDTRHLYLQNPELNNQLYHRTSAIQRETNRNNKIPNIEQTNKLNSSRKSEEKNEEVQSDSNKTSEQETQSSNSSSVKRDEWTLCDFINLPQWLQHNEFLFSGHRPPLNSFTACFQSIFRIHTETVNIWSHMFGCILFIVLAINLLFRQSNLQEKLIFAPFFAGAILCLGFSFIFHTLYCHSPRMMKLFSQLDYCGIAFLIMGSYVSWLYFGFYCHYQLRVFYTVTILTLGICAVALSLLEKFGKPEYRPFRASVFSFFGLSGIAPGMHILSLDSWDSTLGVPLLSITFLYILGAVLYASRIPERLLPGRCDIWFHSHQVFHILVVIATIVNYRGLVNVYQRSIALKCL